MATHPVAQAIARAVAVPVIGGGLLQQALDGAFDLGTASADTDTRVAATTSPFTLNEVASGTVITELTSVGTRVACDDAATNMLSNADLPGTPDTEATPTGWTWGGVYDDNGRRWIRSAAFSGKNAIELMSGSQQPAISQTVAGLSIGVDYTVGVYVEEFDCIAPHLILGVDGAAIDIQRLANGFTGWHWATFTATATSHTINIGHGIASDNTGRVVLSMPFMVAGTDPTIYTETSRSAQTLTLDADGLVGGAVTASYGICTAEWDFTNGDVSVAYTTGAGQTGITLTQGAASLVLIKEGGWTTPEQGALTAALQALPRLSGYRSSTDAIPGLVEWGDSTTAAGQDESIDVPSAMQASMPGVTVLHQGVGGETSAQIEARMVAAAKDDLRPWVVGINAGANDINADIAVSTVMTNIADMVTHCGHGRFYVRTPLRNTGWSAARVSAHADLVSEIRSTYPNNLVDVYAEIGDSYKDDAIHPNSEGYQIIANLIQSFLESKGWLSDVHSASVSTPDADTYAANASTTDSGSSAGQRLKVYAALEEYEANLRRLGVWTSFDQVLPFAGSDLTAALVPLKGTAPTNNGFVSGDYAEGTGLSADGASYLDSGYAVAATGGYSMMVYGDNLPLSGAEQGIFCNDERFSGVGSGQYFGLLHFNNLQRYSPPAVTTIVSQFARQTLLMTSYEDDDFTEASGNGTALDGNAVTRFTSPRNLYLFCRNFGGTANAFMSTGDMWIAGWGTAGIPAHKHLLLKRANNLLARRLGRLTVMAR